MQGTPGLYEKDRDCSSASNLSSWEQRYHIALFILFSREKVEERVKS